jgi:hypothetical protein
MMGIYWLDSGLCHRCPVTLVLLEKQRVGIEFIRTFRCVLSPAQSAFGCTKVNGTTAKHGSPQRETDIERGFSHRLSQL